MSSKSNNEWRHGNMASGMRKGPPACSIESTLRRRPHQGTTTRKPKVKQLSSGLPGPNVWLPKGRSLRPFKA
eukprot:8625708-Heterocapsa_arctica.AAC.1